MKGVDNEALRVSPHPADTEASAETNRPAKSLRSRTIEGILWSLSGAVGRTLSRIVGIAILARLIGPHEFGLWAIVMLVYTPVLDLIGAGISPTLIRQKDLATEELQRALALTILLGLLVAAVLVVGAELIVPRVNSNLSPHLFVLAGIAVCCRTINFVSRIQLTRDLAFRMIALMGTVSTAIGFWVVTVPLALLGWNEWALGIGCAVESLTMVVVGWCLCPTLPRSDIRRLSKYFREAAGFCLTGTLNSWARQVDNYVTAIFLGPAMLGVYTKTYALSTLPSRMIAQSTENVLLPAFSQRQGNLESIRRNFLLVVQGYALLITPMAAVTALFADEIVAVMLGPDWTEVAPPLRVLSFAMLVRALSRTPLTILKSFGKVRLLVTFQLLSFSMILVGAIALLRFKLTGVAIAVDLATATFAWLAFRSALHGTDSNWRALQAAVLPVMSINVVLAVLCGLLRWRMQSLQLSDLTVLLLGFVAYLSAYITVIAIAYRRLVPLPMRQLVDAAVRHGEKWAVPRRQSLLCKNSSHPVSDSASDSQ